MSLKKLEDPLIRYVADRQAAGTAKGKEKIIAGIRTAEAGYSERYFLEGFGERAFLRMNSNSYLGLSLHPRVIEAEAAAAERFGTGPGAVRFISGTYRLHVELEKALASFHGRESAMIVSAAYATVMGVLPQLISEATLVVSDVLNHNSIITAIQLSRAAEKSVYAHLTMQELDNILGAGKGRFKRACVVSDGVFSMRGDHAPLDDITAICRRHEAAYDEGIITVVDDSHGVGAFGATGRGTEEVTRARVDVLIATLGKALGVNGGYVVSSAPVIHYLRETVPFYLYSNPITPAEAAAAIKALQILESDEGAALLAQLRKLGAILRTALKDLGYETISGDHPIVPIFIRDTEKTSALVKHLFDHDILVTGMNYPVVPKGDEEIRLQVSASHMEKDIDVLIDCLRAFKAAH